MVGAPLQRSLCDERRWIGALEMVSGGSDSVVQVDSWMMLVVQVDSWTLLTALPVPVTWLVKLLWEVRVPELIGSLSHGVDSSSSLDLRTSMEYERKGHHKHHNPLFIRVHLF